jgi:hypothetical protein
LLGDYAITVILFLVDPSGTVEGFAKQGSQHGLNAKRNAIRQLARLLELVGGSALAAFATSPPLSRAMSAMRRLELTERGFLARTSSVDAY